jgi:hypothetical protein
MAYIGTKPTVGNFQICDAISVVNGQAAYTMQVGGVNVNPQSANHMIVSLNGTIQKPNSSFTVANSVITFSSNLATGDVIDFIQILGDVLDLGVPSDATVTTAKLGANSVTAAKLNNDIISGSTELASEPADTDEFLVSDAGTLKRIDYSLIKGGGITMADQWRVTAASSTSGQVEIDSNWERVDSRGLGTLGTGMTESSGIFTFPSTGIYLVTINLKTYQGSGDQRYVHAYIFSTTDNSSYDRVAESSMWFTSAGDGGSKYGSSTCNVLFDVTNTSTHKIKFRKNSEATITAEGDTDINLTFATFIRLGDT